MSKKNAILYGVSGLILVAGGVVAYIKRKAIKEAGQEVYQHVKNKLCITDNLPQEVKDAEK